MSRRLTESGNLIHKGAVMVDVVAGRRPTELCTLDLKETLGQRRFKTL